jgi:hypothetical protein
MFHMTKPIVLALSYSPGTSCKEARYKILSSNPYPCTCGFDIVQVDRGCKFVSMQ